MGDQKMGRINAYGGVVLVNDATCSIVYVR